MARLPKPFTIRKRNDSGTFQITLNVSCGLPHRVCQEWKRRSFQDLPDELAGYRSPKNGKAAEPAVFALIKYLATKQEEDPAKRITSDEISVGAWLEKFTSPEKSPRAALIAAKNRPYSPKTLALYESFFNRHIKGDPVTNLKMLEVEEGDILEFTNRMANRTAGKSDMIRKLIGTRTFEGVLKFVRMAFKEYRRTHRKWLNPFDGIDPPQAAVKPNRGALTEDEVVSLFIPDVLDDSMELAVCAVMFLSGLRRSEIFALKPECLDWHTPKITVKNAWQNFDKKSRVFGPPKGKRERDAPFDPVLQEAVKKLWAENGRHEFVFSYADGRTPGPSWIKGRFPKWLAKAGIEPNGRKIVPHSARHSLATILEARGVSLRYIQDLLGHSSMATTKGYLHSTERTIRVIGEKISEAMNRQEPENILKFG